MVRGNRNASSCCPLPIPAYLRTPPLPAVREALPGKARAAVVPSERHLQCVWFDPSLRPAILRTADRQEVTVEEPGRWNLEAGPDFLNAVLKVMPSGRRIRGDVEIHVSPRDWTDHGHGADPAYRNVVAHVCYHAGTLPVDALPPGTLEIALEEDLSRNPLFSFDGIDLAAYPHAAISAATAPCREILQTWSEPARAALLDAAGTERMRLKTDRMAQAIAAGDPAQVLYEEFLCALGYKHNRMPFRRLARVVTLEHLRAAGAPGRSNALSLLLGVSGLLPTRAAPGWDDETRAYVRSLWTPWWKVATGWEDKCIPRSVWRLSGIRPANHPVRRMVAAVDIFCGQPDIVNAARDTAASSWVRRLTGLLSMPAGEPYWQRHMTIGGMLQEAPQQLLGADRTHEILLNVLVPFAAALGADVAGAVREVAPGQDNAVLRDTALALFGRDHNPAFHRASALRQQGLLQIFGDFCLAGRGCAQCPFPAALESYAQEARP